MQVESIAEWINLKKMEKMEIFLSAVNILKLILIGFISFSIFVFDLLQYAVK